jgi:signal transduction histidine kinase/CheY-like chemotaxis protein
MKKNSLVRDISIRPLLIASFLVSGLIPIMIVSLIGFSTAKTELKEQVFRQLESVRNIKKVQIENFFSQRIKDISVFAANPYVIEAYNRLEKAFNQAGGAPGQKFNGRLEEVYDAPHSYREIHDRYFPYFKYLIEQYGYYDLFLMNPGFGDTLFTVRKESDFGIRIGQVSSSLRDVWLKVMNTGGIALSDTRPYPPSDNAPAQFLAAPIRQNNRTTGVIAVQISIDSIDEIMKERSGMWKTGETYLVGQDKKMRSDSYMDPANHSVHASFNGTAAANGVDTDASRAALKGITAAGIIRSYRNREVLSAYTPIIIEGVKWAIIAEVDIEEIELQIANALNNKIIFLFLASALVLFLLSMIVTIFISKGIKNTIVQLEQMIKDVLKGNLKARGDSDSVNSDFKAVVHSANQLIEAFASQWEEKRKLEEHMQYTQKLKAIGALAGGIAHDFNNILTSMFAFSHIVRAELPPDSPASEPMKEIVAALQRASELVDQILTFGRQANDEKQNVEISSIISGTLKLLEATLSKNITLLGRLPEEKIYIDASPSQVNQIVMNLCTNASYAMRESGGIMTVSAESICRRGDESPAAKPGAFCKLTVSDTGHGIEPAIKDRIFDPFFTTKPVGEGSGMGLSMVHGIVWNYGGWIDVQSTPGEGSTFHVYLPEAEPAPRESQEPDAVELPTGSGEKILFVDDESQICNSEAHILEAAGYDVYAVTDPREAEKIFREMPGGFDIVITDLNMPHIDGIELAERLMKLRPNTPVILTSGYRHYSRLVNREKIEKTGIAAFLKKPYDNGQLVQAVFDCLRRPGPFLLIP